MVDEKKMLADDFIKNYEEVTPVSNYVLVEVIAREQGRLLKSGLLVDESAVTNNKPYLIVRALSPQLQQSGWNIEVDDIVEVGNNHIAFFYGQNLEKFALLNSGQIAGVHKKKKV